VYYRLARLSDAGGDLTKQWVVVYYAWSEKRKTLVRKRVIIKGSTVAERMKDAELVIKEINKQLKAGAYVNGDKPALDSSVTEPAGPLLNPTESMAKAIEYFLAIKKSTLKANSHKTYRSSLKLFQVYLSDKNLTRLRLNQFSAQQAHAYMDYVITELGLSNKSYNKHLGVMETLFNFYLQRQHLKANPFVSVKPLAERPGRHTAFTDEQVAKVRQACMLGQD